MKKTAGRSSRRAFLKASGIGMISLGAGSLGLGPQFLSRVALAAPGPGANQRRKVLVTIFQRGAMDGLMAVPPLEGRELSRLRPNLAMSAARSSGDAAVLELGSGFGLHPSLAPLGRLFEEGRLSVVHAVGSPDPTRSHFDAQDYMESGTPGNKGTRSGWLNRVVGELGHEGSVLRAVSMTQALPRSFYGDESAVALTRLDELALGSSGGSLRGRRSDAMSDGGRYQAERGFEALYRDAQQQLLRDTGSDSFEALDLLDGLDAQAAWRQSGGSYPDSELGRSLFQIALLIKARIGLEVAFAESGGWDTHVRQGTNNGSFARRARDLAQAVAAFWSDLGEHADDVVLMTMTEFGRTARENGSGGTDHGHGSCLFLLGHQIESGVFGRLDCFEPGSLADSLYEGRDLPVTTDFRSVFAEVAARHLGVDDRAAIFPGFQGSAAEAVQGELKDAPLCGANWPVGRVWAALGSGLRSRRCRCAEQAVQQSR